MLRKDAPPLLFEAQTDPRARVRGQGQLFDSPRLRGILEVWEKGEPFNLIPDAATFAEAMLDAYPEKDLETESRKIRAWWIANPSKRKNKRNVRRFVNGWFSRADVAAAEGAAGGVKPRDASVVWGREDES